jgi:hypothetical protein
MTIAALATFTVAMLHQAQHPSQASRPLHAYVLGGALLTVQPAGPIIHRYGPAVSGKGAGFFIAGGYALAPRLALEGELNVGGDISGAQHYGYNEVLSNDYIRHNRDITATGQARISAGFADIVAGAGLGVTRIGRTNSTTTTLRPSGDITVGPDADYWSIRKSATFTYGLDFPIPSRSRVQIMPTFRGHIMRRPDSDYDDVGASAYVLQLGIAMRFGGKAGKQ